MNESMCRWLLECFVLMYMSERLCIGLIREQENLYVHTGAYVPQCSYSGQSTTLGVGQTFSTLFETR